MKLSDIDASLVLLAETRNHHIVERDRLAGLGNVPLGWAHEAGMIAGLQAALDIFRDAGFAVASAEYLAKP